MKKQDAWKIIYHELTGAERAAAEFLSREAGRYLIREEDVFTLYVLPVEQEGAAIPENAIVLGVYAESALIRSLIPEAELPAEGYLIRSVPNPANAEGALILLTAREKTDLFYAAAALIDRVIPEQAPDFGGQVYTDRFFDQAPAPFSYASAPAAKTRGVFTWGHPISDYRRYLEDLARQGMNRLILWNDHKPLNADEITAYAHRLGIRLFWGFSWGWIAGCGNVADISPERIAEIKAQVLQLYEKDYAGCGDGIYFQSFTERADNSIGGRSIAETVTELVNETAGALLERYPGLEIQFGLHATSVADRLDAIARVDKRVEIVWEDGGKFPFSRGRVRKPGVSDEEFESAFRKTLDFTRRILTLRGADAKTSVVFKGFALQDWSRFAYQRGPYILGENAPEIAAHDQRLRKSVWRAFSAQWLVNGDYARRFAEAVLRESGGRAGLYLAGLLDGGVYFPEAVCAELFWDPYRPYAEVMRTAMLKPNVRLD